jgi:ribosomal protein S19
LQKKSNLGLNKLKSRHFNRSIWVKIYLKQIGYNLKTTHKYIHNRSSLVPLEFINSSFLIYNGKRWILKNINKWHVGYKFGIYTWNKKLALFKAKQLKKKKK